MSSFSPTDAALEGFRITRERPWAIAAWAALYLAVGWISAILMTLTLGPYLPLLSAIAHGQIVDNNMAVGLSYKLAPLLAMTLPLVLVCNAIIICGVNRAVLTPEALSRGYIRFGRDELRMMGLIVLIALLCAGVLFVALVIDSLVAEALRAVAGPNLEAVAYGFGLASLGVIAWGLIRLSLAAPMTFMTGELHVFRSWALTRGHFRRLFLTYVIAFALVIFVLVLVNVIVQALTTAVMMLAGGSSADIQRMINPDLGALKTYLTPSMILNQILGGILNAAFFTALFSPPAVIYAALTRA